MAPVFHQVLNGSVPPGTPNCLDESLRLPDRTEIHNFLKWNPKWNPRADFGTICGKGSGLSPCFLWCRLQDSNPRPSDYKSDALPAELSRHAGNAVTTSISAAAQAAVPVKFTPRAQTMNSSNHLVFAPFAQRGAHFRPSSRLSRL